jgi:predicted small secreted protein
MKIVMTLIVMFALTACNTIGGLGKDIQSTAEYTKGMMPEKTQEKKDKE